MPGSFTASSYVKSLSPDTRQLLTEGMEWMDTYYDSDAGYLYDFSSRKALRHETRNSVWYALGLLARNKGTDVAEAEKIINNVIAGQYKVPSDAWYGTYQKEPEEPDVGSTAYPGKAYGSWDPNWRDFVGTTFIMMMEEFSDLLNPTTQKSILDSLYHATVGDSYRFGQVGTSNTFFPSYSNPQIMRAFLTGWTGRRLQNANMTKAGESYAQDVINLFNEHNTLSEFNSPTYTGVSLFALILWSKYLPQESVMAKHAPSMVKHTWTAVSQLWHPGLRNIAGPWDRTYGFDMNRYLSVMALWFWPLIGKEKAGLNSKPETMSQTHDFAWAPVVAVLADQHKSLIPEEIANGLSTFMGEHTYSTKVWAPPYDNIPRNVTAWLSDNITVGAEEYDHYVPDRTVHVSFNAAVIQWDTGNEVSFMTLYPSEPALHVDVKPWKLTLSYPYGNADSVFTFVVDTFTAKRTITGWQDVPGLSVAVSGNINQTLDLSFAGTYGGSLDPMLDFEYWKFTYRMPEGFVGIPTIVLDLELRHS
ncbi:hypothetical protein BKA56DRAFT_497921 [Ilyonectria sp. MPI-CAGE-AT-0026]|nr:hypothetical protein BKA56DRAFT_497921 [Ilyonectria sp. MPI-CAGE-AT-0026]